MAFPSACSFRILSVLALLVVSLSVIGQIEEGVVARYYFNDGTAMDNENDNDGEVNGATPVPDRFGNVNSCFQFDGNDDNIDLPNSTDLKPDFPFSLSIWVKFDQIDPDVSSYIYLSNIHSSGYAGFWLGYIPSGQVSASYGDGLGTGAEHRRTKHSDLIIDTTEWHHFTAVYHELNSIDLYIDCILDDGYYSGSAYQMMYNDHMGSLAINQGDGSVPHTGKIDDIRLYNRALSFEEIQELCTEHYLPNHVVEEFTEKNIGLIMPTQVKESFKLDPKAQNVLIFDSTGRLILEYTPENADHNVSQLQTGFYLVVWKDKYGQVFTSRLFKE